MQEHLWVEKYRPTTIEECILPSQLKKDFEQILKQKELQNMLLTGTAGTGKTTVAKAMCKELNLDYIIINGSEESGIDTLRNKIKQFASSVSLEGGYKVVILDEADYNMVSPTYNGGGGHDVGVYARIIIPLDKPKERINCNTLYKLALERERLEVQRLKAEVQNLRALQFENDN